MTLNYDGISVASATYTDLTTGATAVQYWGLRMPAFVGGDTAFLGFTGGTGSFFSNQSIRDFSFHNTTKATTTLAVGAAAGTYGGTTTLTASLAGLGTPMAGELVTFGLNGALVGSALTDANGTATLRDVSLATLGVGAYSGAVTASFAGDANFASSAGSADLAVAPAPLTIAANDQTRVYGQPNPAISASFIGLVNGDTPASLAGTLSFATSATPASDVGPYVINVTGVSSPNYSVTFAPGTLTIIPATLIVTPDNLSKTYGDGVNLTGTITGQKNGDAFAATYASDGAAASADVGVYSISVAGLSGAKLSDYNVIASTGSLTVSPAPLTVTPTDFTRIYGAANPMQVGTISGIKNGDDITASYATAATPTSDVGAYPITATLSGAKLYDYSVTASVGTLMIAPAPALAVYTGTTVITADSSGNISVPLQAQVQDNSGGVGDIRNAAVTFRIYDLTGTTLLASLPGSAVSLVNPGDLTTGVSSATWTGNLAGASQQSYQVVVVVGHDYAGGTAADPATLIASMPVQQPPSGGSGQLAAATSAGAFAADVNSRILFAFSAKDTNGTPSGSATITFSHTADDGTLHSYQIQSTSIASYGVDPSTGRVTLIGTASLVDVTQPLAPLTIASNLSLQISATDLGNPGRNDSIAITLWGGGLLYFSSDWDGLQSLQQTLRAGNIQVR